jgi:hypothetical protein
MARNFQVSVPIEVNLHIKQGEVVPYLHMVELSRTDKSKDREVTKAIRAWAKKNLQTVMKLTFPGGQWSDVFKRNRTSYLANPHYSAAVFFIAGKNCNKITGHPAGTEMFIIDDIIYRRITWRSIGVRNRSHGMVSKSGGKDNAAFSYYLLRCKKSNRDPLKSTILAGLSEGVFKEPESETLDITTANI